jgi:Skp family chaperone for outer membrane proteins
MASGVPNTLEDLHSQVQHEFTEIREQLALMQARLAAFEAQMAHVEPMIEARAARTDRIALELQMEFRRWQKQFHVHEELEQSSQKSVQDRLDKILDKLT